MAIDLGLLLAEGGKAAGRWKDRRDERQMLLEDRLAAKEMRDLQRQSLEKALNAPPPPEALERVLDDDGNEILVPRGQAAGRRVRTAPAAPEPLERVTDPKTGQPVFVPRSGAAGRRPYEAPPQDNEPLVQVAGPDGKPIWVRRSAAVGKPAYQAPPKPKTLPSTAVEKMIALDNLMATAKSVRDAVQEAIANKVNVTGRTVGIKTPNWVKNAVGMGGDVGKDIRTQIGALFSEVAKERGGSALSESEIGILETFVPNEHEDEGTVLLKANRFLRKLKELKAAKLRGYEQYGGAEFDEPAEPEDYRSTLPYPEP